MGYLIYEQSSGYVIEIVNDPVVNPGEGLAVLESPDYKPGDEFEFLINVLSHDGQSNAYTISAVRQARAYTRILQENKMLKDNQEVMQEESNELNLTIGNLILESANDKATIASLEETVGTLLFEVAALKGGAE